MPVNNDYPTLDGYAPSWADIVVKITATGAPVLDVKDITAINSGCAVEIGATFAGGRKMKRTTGKATYTGSMTLYREGYQKLLRTLMAVAPARGARKLVSLVSFDIQVQHTPPGSTEVFDVRLLGCRISGRDLNGAEGSDPDTVEVPLDVMEIIDVIDGTEVAIL